MAIVNMKRLHMLALESDRNLLFDKLQHLGCVEVSEQSDKLSDPEWAALVHRDESALEQQKKQLDLLQSALSALDTYAPVKTKLLSPRPTAKEAQLFDQAALDASLQLAQSMAESCGELNQVTDQMQKQTAALQALEPWLSLDVPLDTAPAGSLYTAFGMIPATVDLEAVRKDLALNAEAAELYEASTDQEMHYLFFLCHVSQQEDALDVLKSYGFSNTSFKGITGTAQAAYDQGKQLLSGLEQRQEGLLSEIRAHQDQREALQLSCDRMTLEVQKETCKERLLGTDQTFFLEGWVSEPEIPALEALLGQFDCAYDLADPTEEEYPQVPIKLKNNKLTDSLNTVTEMYSLPAYGSLDPNPLMAPFFILFYGMMMADMGYGLLMFFGCWFAIKKMRPKGGTYHLLSLIKYCGISTFIWGAVTGGFFGDFIPQIVQLTTGKEISLPALFSPLDDALAVLIGSLALGLAQILTGMGISMYKQIKRGQVMAALCNEGAWYVVFILIAVAALTGAVKPCIIAIVVVLVLTQGYGKKGILGKLGGIGGSLYNNVTGYFSDILSYSRLMALMLAGAVIAQVFNTLGALTGNVVTFVIISLVGNALNFALNLLGCYVHDLRLQCLEFFSRFYEDGGKPFEPIQIDTNYVEIIQ
jgi:V/A-type H+-transporting ATPase subunit I